MSSAFSPCRRGKISKRMGYQMRIRLVTNYSTTKNQRQRRFRRLPPTGLSFFFFAAPLPPSRAAAAASNGFVALSAASLASPSTGSTPVKYMFLAALFFPLPAASSPSALAAFEGSSKKSSPVGHCASPHRLVRSHFNHYSKRKQKFTSQCIEEIDIRNRYTCGSSKTLRLQSKNGLFFFFLYPSTLRFFSLNRNPTQRSSTPGAVRNRRKRLDARGPNEC